MTGKTHKRISLMFSYIGCLILCVVKPAFMEQFIPMESFEWTLKNCLNFYMMMAVCSEFCKEGTLFPDLDHAWANLKEKTALTKVINVIIHLTGGKHRSKQTHSADIAIICTAVYLFVTVTFLQDTFTYPLWLIGGIGFFGGWLTHLFADMLTSDGIYLFCWQKKKISFVPKSLFGFKFNTGGAWEDFVFKIATFLEWTSCTLACLYPIGVYVWEKFFAGTV